MQDFKKKTDFKKSWAEARAIVWDNKVRLLFGLLLLTINRLAGFVLPWSSKFLIDDVLPQRDSHLLLLLVLAVGGATVVQAATTFSLSQLLSIAAQRTITEFRKSVERHVMRLPVSYFDSTKSGTLISRIMSDAEGIRNLVGTGLIQLVGGAFTALLALGVLFYLNWNMTLLLLVVMGSFGGFMARMFRKVRPIFRERSKIQAEVSGRLGEGLGAIRVVKAFRSERHEDRVFAIGAHRLYRNVSKTITAISATTSLSSLIFGLAGGLILWMGGTAVLASTMTQGDLFLYIFLTAMVVAPMVQMASIGTQITEAFAGLDRIREIREMTTEEERDSGKPGMGRIDGEVVFEDVHFSYKPGVPVIRGVSFRAAAGSTTALVGSSGSGKSTLVGLIMAFNQPESGRILVDGQDLSKIRLRDYRGQLGVVLQDNVLFDGTIAENIGYARPTATRQEIEDAARTAHCQEFVDAFEEGFETVVGERGVKLSGGQRQRVAIARAILAAPRLLILDEATSSLDSESEGKIQDGLRALRRGRTTFVIAHRLSTIRSADQILVIEQGNIVECGTHAELHALGGRYRELHDRQYRFESDRFINPGEDFTPQPERESAVPAAGRRGGGFRMRE